MDLLQGYGSDGSSASSASSAPCSSSFELNTTKSKNNSNKDNKPLVHAPKSILKTSTITKANDTSNAKTKRGTKILKLNSVLPPDILERLTRSTVQNANVTGSNRFDSSSSSSSDDDGSNDNNNDDYDNNDSTTTRRKGISRSATRIQQKKNHTTFLNGHKNDTGIHSLLSQLQSVAPTNTATTTATTTTTTTVTTDNTEVGEKMGMAFMNVSNTIVRKKQQEDVKPVDIHYGNNKNKKVQSLGRKRDRNQTNNDDNNDILFVEDVNSDDEQEDNSNATTANNKKNAIHMFQQRHGHNNNSNYDGEVIKNDNKNKTSTSMSMPMRSQAINPFKRSKISISSSSVAPIVPNYNNYKNSDNNQVTQHYNQQDYYQHQYQQQLNQPIKSFSTEPKKMSKRELEKALRSGNFDAIHSSNITQTIDTTTYVQPTQNDLLQIASTSTSNHNPSQYRISGGGQLQTYVPSEGTTVATNEISSKQKSKHQIHSLVVSARKLEADRARMEAMGMGGKKSSRADAKKKYGW